MSSFAWALLALYPVASGLLAAELLTRSRRRLP
jgi:hypothetical protein